MNYIIYAPFSETPTWWICRSLEAPVTRGQRRQISRCPPKGEPVTAKIYKKYAWKATKNYTLNPENEWKWWLNGDEPVDLGVPHFQTHPSQAFSSLQCDFFLLCDEAYHVAWMITRNPSNLVHSISIPARSSSNPTILWAAPGCRDIDTPPNEPSDFHPSRGIRPMTRGRWRSESEEPTWPILDTLQKRT
jgi:hypothetical protein